jgi:hypothetical protein
MSGRVSLVPQVTVADRKKQRTRTVDGTDLITHRPTHAMNLHQLRRCLDPRALQSTVLDEDFEHGGAALCRDPLDDSIEDLGVVEDVNGFAAGKREGGQNLVNDVEALGFGCGCYGVGDDVKRGV